MQGPVRALAFVAALAALLIAAPAANAAFGISSFSAQPANKAAGANSDLSVSFGVTDSAAGLRDITVHLPPGLIGNPLATPTCSEAKLKADDCPAKSDVGDATNGVTVKPLGLLPIPLTVSGQVYNVEPRKGEPARFGIVLDPAPVPGLGAALPKIVLQQTAKLRQSDFGLDTALKDIPRSAKIAGISTPLEVTNVALTLKGKVNGGKGFLRNPTSCGVQTVSIDATAYNGAHASSQDQFTTTNCAALPFSPKFGAKIRQLSADPLNPVELSTTISQTIAEAGLKKATVTLPTEIQGNADALGDSVSRSRLRRRQLPGQHGGRLRRRGLAVAGAAAQRQGLPRQGRGLPRPRRRPQGWAGAEGQGLDLARPDRFRCRRDRRHLRRAPRHPAQRLQPHLRRRAWRSQPRGAEPVRPTGPGLRRRLRQPLRQDPARRVAEPTRPARAAAVAASRRRRSGSQS